MRAKNLSYISKGLTVPAMLMAMIASPSSYAFNFNDAVRGATGGVINPGGGPLIRPPDPAVIVHPLAPVVTAVVPEAAKAVPVPPPPSVILPIVTILPHLANPQKALNDLGKDAEHALDVGQDIVTFGQHGRDRDKARGETEEALAKARREGAENTKIATVNGLKAQLEATNQSIKRWERFNEQLPGVLDYQKQLVGFATQVLTNSIDVQGTLKAMGPNLQDASGGLKVLLEALKNAPKSEDRFAEADTWNFAVGQLAKTIQNSQDNVQKYLSRAILQADTHALADFIDVVSKSRNRVEQLTAEAKQNLETEKSNKDSLEKQLAALK